LGQPQVTIEALVTVVFPLGSAYKHPCAQTQSKNNHFETEES